VNATAWIIIVGAIVAVAQLHNISTRLSLILDQLREDARDRTDRAEVAGEDEFDMQRALDESASEALAVADARRAREGIACDRCAALVYGGSDNLYHGVADERICRAC